jgi:uncharacterized protein (DUF302 family)
MSTKYFQTISDNLAKAKVPCKVKLTEEGRVIVECGFNYPDSLFDKIMYATDDADIDVCAEESGNRIISSRLIAGGPQKYSRINRR